MTSSCGSNIFLARTVQSVFGSTVLACATALALSLPSVVGLVSDPRSLLNAPLVLAAVVAAVVVASRRYARTAAPATNRFGRFARGLSFRSCWLAALCSAVAWALSTVSPVRGSGYGTDARSPLDVGCAVVGVLYHYENVYFQRDFHFPVVQTAKYAMFTSGLADVVRRSARTSSVFAPFVYVALSAPEPTLRCDVRFVGAVWFSAFLVLFLLYSFEHILYLNMTERFVFPIVTVNNPDGVSLLSVLGSDNKIVKSLALHDLYQATIKDAKRRKEIFGLSFAGNVPQSWKVIFNFCINNIRLTTEDLTDSVKRVAPEIFYRRNVPNARLLRVNDASCCEHEKSLNVQKKTIKFLENNKAYNYLFGQLDKEKSLEEFEITVWCCYILSNLAVVSLKEDEYGVVREQLGDIVSAILNLKSQLSFQRRQVDPQNTKKLDYLKIHVKTCAVMLALNFGMYANDIGLDETQLLSFKKLITSLFT